MPYQPPSGITKLSQDKTSHAPKTLPNMEPELALRPPRRPFVRPTLAGMIEHHEVTEKLGFPVGPRCIGGHNCTFPFRFFPGVLHVRHCLFSPKMENVRKGNCRIVFTSNVRYVKRMYFVKLPWMTRKQRSTLPQHARLLYDDRHHCHSFSRTPGHTQQTGYEAIL